MAYVRPSALLCSSVLCLAPPLGCSDDAVGDGTEGASGTEGTAATAGTNVGSAGSAGDDVVTSAATGGTTDAADTTAGEGSDSSGEPPGGLPCLDDQFVNGPSPGPDYADFEVTIGSHCQGTDQQDIEGIERVVFVGDSVSVGTRPTPVSSFYRVLVANELADMYGLMPPEALWNQVDIFGGTSIVQQSGDFASCAVWGARNDDLMTQLDDCFAPEDFDLRTLVIFTMGGNDVSSIAQDAIGGAPVDQLLAELETMVANHEMAIQWLTAPDRFPNGVFVVNANVYEFTDYTADLLSCPTAAAAGFDTNPDDPALLLDSLTLINEEYTRIAQENGTDLVFMFEGFCGHGFRADDPTMPCYRGPDNDNWFDFTCIHPTATGHEALADMFINVISE